MSETKTTKILLAEDDRFLSLALGDKLLREGYHVIKVMTGAEVTETAKKEKPDLILLDLIMPGKSGFQVLEELKGENEVAGIPVVVISNLGQDSDIAKAKALGAVDYFVKSDVKMADLVQEIKKYLK